MDINNIVEQALNNLLSGNRIFNSEADFQFALAWQIKQDFPEVEILLEYTPWKFKNNIRIDIVVLIDDAMIPIELKYKTKKYKNEKTGLVLKNQGAQDIGRYDFLSDIKRLENFMDSKDYNVKKAYAIFLTNDSLYWNEPKFNKRTVDEDFRFHNGITLHGSRKWKGASTGTQKKREEAINIKGTYEMHWQDYDSLTECTFKYVVVEINP